MGDYFGISSQTALVRLAGVASKPPHASTLHRPDVAREHSRARCWVTARSNPIGF